MIPALLLNEAEPQAAGQRAVRRWRRVSDWGTVSATGVPERQHLQASERLDESVVEIVMNAREVEPPYASERAVPRASADLRLQRD